MFTDNCQLLFVYTFIFQFRATYRCLLTYILYICVFMFHCNIIAFWQWL